MSFLKTMWRINNSRHKKLNEELALASSIRDFAESPLDLNDEEVSDDPIMFNLKYLGNTVMTPATQNDDKNYKKLKLTKKSQMITTSAIKKVISASKSQKKLPEVSIAISPKGIETFDAVTEEPLLKVPIDKISFCSIDAAHDTIFSFVSSPSDKEPNRFQSQQFGSPESPAGQLESNSLEDEEGLVLHAFQCQKRKIAHNVTMTVARAFERAFQIYQNEQFLEDIRNKDSKNKENLESQKNAANIKKLISDDGKAKDAEDSSCLIDLGSENGPQLNSLYSKEQTKEYFQTTWVSFE